MVLSAVTIAWAQDIMSSVFDERDGTATPCLEVDLFADPRTWTGEQPERETSFEEFTLTI